MGIKSSDVRLHQFRERSYGSKRLSISVAGITGLRSVSILPWMFCSQLHLSGSYASIVCYKHLLHGAYRIKQDDHTIDQRASGRQTGPASQHRCNRYGDRCHSLEYNWACAVSFQLKWCVLLILRHHFISLTIGKVVLPFVHILGRLYALVVLFTLTISVSHDTEPIIRNNDDIKNTALIHSISASSYIHFYSQPEAHALIPSCFVFRCPILHADPV